MDKMLDFNKLNNFNCEETMAYIIKCFEEAINNEKKLLKHIEMLERQLAIQDRAILNLQDENLKLQLDKAELEELNLQLGVDEEYDEKKEDSFSIHIEIQFPDGDSL